MQGDGIVDLSANLGGGQVRSEGISLAVGDANDVLVPDMPAAGVGLRQGDDVSQPTAGEQIGISARVPLTVRCPGIKVGQFDPQDCRLKRVESTIDADHFVVVTRLHAMHPQLSQRVSQIIASGGQEAAIAEGPEVFGGIEAETADVADASRAASVPG